MGPAFLELPKVCKTPEIWTFEKIIKPLNLKVEFKFLKTLCRYMVVGHHGLWRITCDCGSSCPLPPCSLLSFSPSPLLPGSLSIRRQETPGSLEIEAARKPLWWYLSPLE